MSRIAIRRKSPASVSGAVPCRLRRERGRTVDATLGHRQRTVGAAVLSFLVAPVDPSWNPVTAKRARLLMGLVAAPRDHRCRSGKWTAKQTEERLTRHLLFHDRDRALLSATVFLSSKHLQRLIFQHSSGRRESRWLFHRTGDDDSQWVLGTINSRCVQRAGHEAGTGLPPIRECRNSPFRAWAGRIVGYFGFVARRV